MGTRLDLPLPARHLHVAITFGLAASSAPMTLDDRLVIFSKHGWKRSHELQETWDSAD
jgi:hypothetical protein